MKLMTPPNSQHGNSYELSGRWMGTATICIRRPDVKTSVIIFSNNANLNASEFTFPILDITDKLCLGDK